MMPIHGIFHDDTRQGPRSILFDSGTITTFAVIHSPTSLIGVRHGYQEKKVEKAKSRGGAAPCAVLKYYFRRRPPRALEIGARSAARSCWPFPRKPRHTALSRGYHRRHRHRWLPSGRRAAATTRLHAGRTAGPGLSLSLGRFSLHEGEWLHPKPTDTELL